jgi:hypothetical protein
VFTGRGGKPLLVTSLDYLHANVRKTLKMAADFVVHSLRHTMLTLSVCWMWMLSRS